MPANTPARGYFVPGEPITLAGCYRDGFNFCAKRSDDGGATDIFRAMLMYGGDEFDPNNVHPWREPGGNHVLNGCTFPNNYQLVGKTYLVCWAAQYGARGNWIEQGGVSQGPQEVNALIRGIDLPIPTGDGNIEYGWTENAASARHWFMTEQLLIKPESIDYDSFKAAYDLCEQRIFFPEVHLGDVFAESIISASGRLKDTEQRRQAILDDWNKKYAGEDGNLPNGEPKSQRRYSINGIVTGREVRAAPKEVSDAMDVAWHGVVVQNGREYYMRPGASRTPVAHITEQFVMEQLPVIQAEPALRDKANAADVELVSSAGHDWGSHRLPRIRDEVAIARDGVEFSRTVGVYRFVAYVRTAERLINQTLKQETENRTVSLQVPAYTDTGSTPFAPMIPSDTVTVDLPKDGLAGVWRVQATELTPNGLISAQLLEEPPNLYESKFSVPIGDNGEISLGGIEPPPMNELFPVKYTKTTDAEVWALPFKHNGRNLQWQWERLKGGRLSAGNVDWGFNQGQSEYQPDELVANPLDTVVIGTEGSTITPDVRALFYITSTDQYQTTYVSPPQGNRTYSATRDAINWWGDGTHLTGPDALLNGEQYFRIGGLEGDTADGAVFNMASPWNDTLVGVAVRTYTWSGDPRAEVWFLIHNPDYDPDDPRTDSQSPQYDPSYSFAARVRRTLRNNYFTFFDGTTFVSTRPDAAGVRSYNDQNVGFWRTYFHSPKLHAMFNNLAPGQTVVMGIGKQMTQNVGQAFVPPNPTQLSTSNTLPVLTWPDSDNHGIRVSARYVRVREDGTLFPLSLWANEYRGDWIHLDAGVFMAGQTRAPSNRLKPTVYLVGGEAPNTQLTNIDQTGPRLREFKDIGNVVYDGFLPTDPQYDNPDTWRQATYDSPVDDSPVAYPYNVRGTMMVNGGSLNGRRIAWAMRLGQTQTSSTPLLSET